MKLGSTTIVGLPTMTVRDLMRELHDPSCVNVKTVHTFLNRLHWHRTVDAARKVNPQIPVSVRQYVDEKEMCRIWRIKFRPVKIEEAERVFAALLAEGYLEPHEPEGSYDKAEYETSRKGRQLAAANLTKRFDRAKADREIADLIERANEIDARDELVFYVSKIIVFGSYLTDSDDLGDIDLVVETQPRRKKHTDESHYRANNSGRSLDRSGRLYYGEREVLQLLRARKARLSFACASTVERLSTETRVLFDWRPDAKRRTEMEVFDWRLHEPLRQAKEWLAANPGINADPTEVARWCQDVAGILSKGVRQPRLFRDWSENAAQDLLSYWGVSASEAAAEKAHRVIWDQYLESVNFYFRHYYENTISTLIDAEIYEYFARGTDSMDAAILVAKRAGWKLTEDNRRGGWVSPLLQRISEMEGRDSIVG